MDAAANECKLLQDDADDMYAIMDGCRSSKSPQHPSIITIHYKLIHSLLGRRRRRRQLPPSLILKRGVAFGDVMHCSPPRRGYFTL